VTHLAAPPKIGSMFKLSTRNLLLSFAVLAAVFLAGAALSNRKPISANATANTAQPLAEAVNTLYTPGLAPERRAYSADEEAYAVSLWRIHDKVKTSAVQLSFAGLSYKLKEIDRQAVKDKITPQLEIYRTARADIDKLKVPQSMATVHETYVKAVGLYEQASAEMIKIAEDGNEQHLLNAHSDTNQASTLLLKVGSELWPGEFKPN
jgi:hypothetical protein